VYDLESLVVAQAPQSMQTAWGETYTLTVNAKADYSSGISFWEPRQQFFIHRTDGGWRIFAVGQAAPPLSWSPQKAAAAAPVAAAPQEAADPSAAVTEVFKEFMTAVLGKDAEAAVKDVSANIRFLRVRQTVTRDELKTTLLGAFDKADFPSALITDSLDMSSIFVESADSPVDGVSGPVYALNVRSTTDLSADVPFWGSYMKFYFTMEDKAWVIFGIM
jgi:hypothetical protein